MEEQSCPNETAQFVFVYGSLRPDDDSRMPWTQDAVEGMKGQRAFLPCAKLYKDNYACVVLGGTENERVVGWVLTATDTTSFSGKMQKFDAIEGYFPSGGGLYDRAIVNVKLSDPKQSIQEPIGVKDDVLRAYVYHRPNCNKDEIIESGDWLQRNRLTDWT